MSLKDHQNMSKKYYRLPIHILLPLRSLRLFPLPFCCLFYSASNMRIPVMIRLKFHEQCAEASGKTVLVSHVPRNKFHNLVLWVYHFIHDLSCDCLWWKYLESCHAHPQARGPGQEVTEISSTQFPDRGTLCWYPTCNYTRSPTSTAELTWEIPIELMMQGYAGACPTNRCLSNPRSRSVVNKFYVHWVTDQSL